MSHSATMLRLTRRARFEAAHRLWSSQLDDAGNLEVYGKCAGEGGHGHNYEIEVSVEGPVDARTGLVVVREELDRAIDESVVARCDHQDLDRVIGAGEVSTGENLSRIFFEWLAPHIPAPARLVGVRVYETPRNIFDALAEGE